MKFNLNKKNWQKVKFGDLVVQQKESISIEDRQLGDRYIAGEHMDTEDIHIRRWGEIDGSYLVPAFHRTFKKGDILYGSRRTYLKKVAVAHFDGITSNTTFVIRPNEEIIDPRLVPFLMLSDKFTQHSVKNSKGSVNPYINFKDIAKFELLIPPLDEQKKLADLLWAGDQLVQKYIKEFDDILIYKNKYFRENYQLDNSNKKDKVSSLFELNPSKEKLSNNQFVSFISMEDVTEDGKIENKIDRKYEEVSTGYKSFIDGDILFAKITPCMENGKGAIAKDLTNGYGFGSTEFHILRPENNSDRSYLYHLSQAPFFRWLAERQMTGSAGQKRVPTDFLLNFKLNLPSLKRRIEIGNRMDEFDQILELINKNITFTKSLNDAIKNQIIE